MPEPLCHPWFVLQGFTAITRALYQYSDPEFEVDAAGTMHEVGHRRVASFTKPSGTVIPLGFFLDPANSDLSAVFFNPRATVSKLVIDPQRSAPPEERVFAAWYMPSTGVMRRQVDVHPSQYHETLADGGYLLLNPYATRPIDPEPFFMQGVTVCTFDPGTRVLTSRTPEAFLKERVTFRVVAPSQ